MIQHLRVARPTNSLEPLLRFYRDGLGLEVLGSFDGHDGFDGLMLGRPDLGWHLEFTCEAEHTAPTAPTEEHLLVLYFATESKWVEAIERLRGVGCDVVTPHNPYWATRGMTFADPDGYRVVLVNGKWD